MTAGADNERIPGSRRLTALSPAAKHCLPELRERLVSLKNSGAQRNDPVRWHFIDALLNRAVEEPVSVAIHLVNRIEAALKEYEVAVMRARTAALDTVEKITARFPAHSASAQALCSAGSFKDLERLANSLARGGPAQILGDLNRQLDQEQCKIDPNPASASFNDTLRQQDREIVGLPDISPTEAILPLTAATSPDARELKAARHFREVREKHHANRLINQAVAQCPPQSGPLNPQLLIVRSLYKMLDLSPHYVNRLVAHINTILWLEHSSQQTTPDKPPRKASRKLSNTAST